MSSFARHALFLTVPGLCALAANTTGCASSGSSGGCSTTPFISPTNVTLDHTLTGTGNSQAFSTGTRYSGNCTVPAVVIAYNWNVSDPVDATVSSNGTVSCVNASAAPITVYSSVTTFTGSGNTLVAQNAPTSLPTATLTCK
jgi:hypothetical protein